MRLGVFAADSSDIESAVEMWRSALLQEPVYTGQAIEQAQQRDGIEFTEVVPNVARNLRVAAKYLLGKGISHDEFLLQASDGIDCDSCRRLDERADCEQLAGDIHFQLGQFDDAFANYRAAIKRTPADTDLRLKLIRRLREQGHNRESKGEAQLGRLLFPQDGRFDAIIKAMAEMDLQEVDERQSTDEPDSP
jgi:tetratricopeptide (TPR) repeat protein